MGGRDKDRRRKISHGPIAPHKQPTAKALAQQRRHDQEQHARRAERAQRRAQTEVDKDVRSKDSSNSALSSDTPAAPRARDTNTAIEPEVEPLASAAAAMANEGEAGTPDTDGPPSVGWLGGGYGFSAKKRKAPKAKAHDDGRCRIGKSQKGHAGHHTAVHASALPSPSGPTDPAARHGGQSGNVGWTSFGKVFGAFWGKSDDERDDDDDGGSTSGDLSDDEMPLATLQGMLHRVPQTLAQVLQQDSCSKHRLRQFDKDELKAELVRRGLDSTQTTKTGLVDALHTCWKSGKAERSQRTFKVTLPEGRDHLNIDEQRTALANLRQNAPRQRTKETQYRPLWEKYLQWCEKEKFDKGHGGHGAFMPTTVSTFLISKATTEDWKKNNLDKWLSALQWGISENYPEAIGEQMSWRVRKLTRVQELIKKQGQNAVMEQRVKELPLLAKVKNPTSRDSICGGVYAQIRQTAAEFKKQDWKDRGVSTPKSSFIKHVTGRFLWVAAENSLARGQEVANYTHPGGMFLYHDVAKEMIGPTRDIGHIVLTHNVNKTNTDGNFPQFAHLFDTPCEFLFASGTQALGELLFVNFEIGNMQLQQEGLTGGWQHLPLCLGKLGKGRDYNTGAVISEGAHANVFKEVKYALGLEAAAAKHMLRSGSSKRRGMECGDFLSIKQDMAYEPGVYEQSYRQECINASTKATGHMGDVKKIAQQRYDVAVFAPRYHEALPSDFYGEDGTLFPKLMAQLDSPSFLDEVAKKGHRDERIELRKVVEHLSETMLRWIAMLQAQVELYKEDKSSVPLFSKFRLDPEELLLVMKTHPVYSHDVFKKDKFATLVESMKTAWLRRQEALTNLTNQAEQLKLADIDSSAKLAMTAALEAKGVVREVVPTLLEMNKKISDMQAMLEQVNYQQMRTSQQQAVNVVAQQLIRSGVEPDVALRFAEFQQYNPVPNASNLVEEEMHGNATGALQQPEAPAARAQIDELDDQQVNDDAWNTPNEQPATPPRRASDDVIRVKPPLVPTHYNEFNKPSQYWSIYNKGYPQESIRPTRTIVKDDKWTCRYNKTDVTRFMKMKAVMSYLDEQWQQFENADENADFKAIVDKVDGWYDRYASKLRRPALIKWFEQESQKPIELAKEGREEEYEVE